MPIVAYNTFAEYLSAAKPEQWPSVTLICGEELLCKKAYQLVLDLLVPESEQALGIETFDGNDVRIDEALNSMNTYALLSSNKVVAFLDARFFYSSRAQKGLKEKMVAAGSDGAWKKASRPFLSLMALYGLNFEDLEIPSARNKVLEDVDGEPLPWFSQLIDYCVANKLFVPESHDDAGLLQKAMEKGFLPGHRLIVTSDIVDRRKALFKAIDANGLVVDCTVPKGESRADRTAQDAVSNAAIDQMLNRAGKKMPMQARRRMMAWTGFDLRTLSGNLEKLISYAGKRKTITDDDVVAVLQKTKRDPIFEFTNAVAERDLSSALSLLQGLLDESMHPLQLLSAVANQIRRLLVCKEFILQDRGRSWNAGLTFAQFKAGPFSTVQSFDKELLSQWVPREAEEASRKGKKKRKKQPDTDLVLVKNTKSPYPVFLMLKKADGFSMGALSEALLELARIDLAMKSGGQDPVLLLEKFLLRFCRK